MEHEGQLDAALTALRHLGRVFRNERDPNVLVDRTCRVMTERLGFARAWVELGGDDRRPSSSPGHHAWPMSGGPRRMGTLFATEPPDAPVSRAALELGPEIAEGLAHALETIELDALTPSALDTQARRAQQALRASEAKLRSYLEHAPVGVLVSTAAGVLLEANAAADALLAEEGLHLEGGTLPELAVEPAAMQAHLQIANSAGRAQSTLPLVSATGQVLQASVDTVRLDSGQLLTTVLDLTDRLAAERGLREREAQYRGVIESSVDGFLMSDLAGRIVEANEAYARQSGYSREALLGMWAWELDADRTEEDWDRGAQVLQARGGLTFETAHRRKDGSLWQVEVVASYRSVAGGRVFAFFRDLSHRQRSEVLTRTRLELARLAETSSVDVLLRFALDTAKSLTESGTGFFDFVDEEKGRGRVGFPPGHMARARELVVPIHRGSRVVAAIGVGNKASPYTDEDLDTLSTLADVVIDTVARRWAEAQLQASEARYRSLVENMEDIVYSLDDEGRLSYVSGAISHLGYRPADVMGQGLDAIVHPEDGTAATTRGVARLNQELRVVDWSGAVRTMRDTRRALEDEDGAISGYVGVLTDLTQQRQTEEALRLAQKMEAIGRLAGGVAHDFNNLLSVILSLTGFALEDLPPGSPLRADLQDVLKAGERASTLTRQLLAFSRRQVLSPKVVSLNRVVEEMQGMLRRLIGEDIELVSRLSEEDTRVRVDVGQLEQVILNLAVNARDAMPTGGQLLLETNPTEVTGDESELQLTVPPGPYARLRITDTGVGMDDATRSRIFEPFFTTKEHGKGTGLGLATVYGIVNQSGGGIMVYSQPGRGTSFDILLPRLTAPEDFVSTITPPPIPHEVLNGRGPVVLVVEDDEGVRTLAERVVRLAGCQPITAPDGLAGLKLAEENQDRLALVLTDVVMPALNGHDLVRRLRIRNPELRVIFMSGYAQDMSEALGASNGSTDFIAKPFTPGKLVKRIQQMLKQPVMARAERSS